MALGYSQFLALNVAFPGHRWLAIAVHTSLIVVFGAIWGWHLTPKANEQEVAQKKGWFFEVNCFTLRSV